MRKQYVVCIGGAMVDEIFTLSDEPVTGTSNPAEYQKSAGGVARNIAQHLAQLGIPVELITYFGEDPEGSFLKENARSFEIGINHSITSNAATGRFAGIIKPDGELFAAAIASELESLLTTEFLKLKEPVLRNARLILAECNLSFEALKYLVEFSSKEKIPLILDPVSVTKARKLTRINLEKIFLITPNQEEWNAIRGENFPDYPSEGWPDQVWIRKGSEGTDYFASGKKVQFPALKTNVADSTGAGDAALAGWIYGWFHEKTLDNCIRYGHSMASLILHHRGATLPFLTRDLLESRFREAYPSL